MFFFQKQTTKITAQLGHDSDSNNWIMLVIVIIKKYLQREMPVHLRDAAQDVCICREMPVSIREEVGGRRGDPLEVTPTNTRCSARCPYTYAKSCEMPVYICDAAQDARIYTGCNVMYTCRSGWEETRWTLRRQTRDAARNASISACCNARCLYIYVMQREMPVYLRDAARDVCIYICDTARDVCIYT